MENQKMHFFYRKYYYKDSIKILARYLFKFIQFASTHFIIPCYDLFEWQ